MIKKSFIPLLILAFLFSFGCEKVTPLVLPNACKNLKATTESTVYSPECAKQLKALIADFDKNLSTDAKNKELLSQKKQALEQLGAEYLKNDKPDEHSKVDNTFEAAIYVYQELPKLIEKEGNDPLIVALGRYIRRNIQIQFLNKNYAESYRLAKKMFEIEPSNAGNQNLYIDSAANLAQIAYDKGNYEEASKLAQEGAAIRYDQKSLLLFGKSLLKLIDKAITNKQYDKAREWLNLAPPIENEKEYNDEWTRLNEKLNKILKK